MLRIVTLAILVAACGADAVDRPELGPCEFWREEALEVAPPQRCRVSFSPEFLILDGEAELELGGTRALVGPIKLRREFESRVLVPMVLAHDGEGQCFVFDCETEVEAY